MIQTISSTAVRCGARAAWAYVDSGWCGCRRTRNSTSGGVLFSGGSMLNILVYDPGGACLISRGEVE